MAESPRYLQIVSEIEAQIAAGTWEGRRMPGVRALAEQFGVSIATASRAIQLLADRGLIDTVERSGCYVRADRPTTSAALALCLRPAPTVGDLATAAALRTGFEEAAREQRLSLLSEQLLVRDDTSERELQRGIERVVALGVQGVCLLPAARSAAGTLQDERFLVQCANVGLPVVLVERNLAGLGRPLPHDLVAADDLDAAHQATRHLLDQDRRTVAFVQGTGSELRLAGYLLALSQAGRTPLVLPQPEGVPTAAAYRQLAGLLLERGVDGVVCYHDHAALGLMVELLARGVNVPRDVALTGFGDLAVGTAYTLGVTTCPLPALDIARQALRLLRDRLLRPQGAPVRVLVPGRLVVRESSLGP